MVNDEPDRCSDHAGHVQGRLSVLALLAALVAGVLSGGFTGLVTVICCRVGVLNALDSVLTDLVMRMIIPVTSAAVAGLVGAVLTGLLTRRSATGENRRWTVLLTALLGGGVGACGGLMFGWVPLGADVRPECALPLLLGLGAGRGAAYGALGGLVGGALAAAVHGEYW